MEPQGRPHGEESAPPGTGRGARSGTRSWCVHVLSRLNLISKHPVVSTLVAAAVIGLFGLGWRMVFDDDDGSDGNGAGDLASTTSEPSETWGPPVLAAFDLEVVVDPDEVGMHQGEPYFYWLPTDVRTLEAPPERCRDRRDWAFDAGGADADAVWARLTVENNRDQQVRVDDLAVEVVEDEATPGGSVAACPVGGASSEPFGLFVDLARDPPGLQFRENEGEEWGPLPGFELDPGEQDSFVIYVAGRSDRLVSWRLVADVRSEGRTSKLVLQDGKDPLRIAGTGGVPMFIWTDAEWERFLP